MLVIIPFDPDRCAEKCGAACLKKCGQKCGVQGVDHLALGALLATKGACWTHLRAMLSFFDDHAHSLAAELAEIKAATGGAKKKATKTADAKEEAARAAKAKAKAKAKPTAKPRITTRAPVPVVSAPPAAPVASPLAPALSCPGTSAGDRDSASQRAMSADDDECDSGDSGDSGALSPRVGGDSKAAAAPADRAAAYAAVLEALLLVALRCAGVSADDMARFLGHLSVEMLWCSDAAEEEARAEALRSGLGRRGRSAAAVGGGEPAAHVLRRGWALLVNGVRVFAACGEVRPDGLFVLSYLDALRDALPDGTPRRTSSALFRAATAAFLATSGALDRASGLLLLACAPQWRVAKGARGLARRVVFLLRPPDGSPDAEARFTPGAKGAAKRVEDAFLVDQQRTAMGRLHRFYDEALRLAAATGALACPLVVRTREAAAAAGEAPPPAIPLVPGCLFAEEFELAAAAARRAGHHNIDGAALQDAALEALASCGATVTLATLRPPEEAVMLEALAMARLRYGDKAGATTLRPVAGRTTEQLRQAFVDEQYA